MAYVTKNDYDYSNLIMGSSQANTWTAFVSNCLDRDAIYIGNQGVSNSLLTNCTIEIFMNSQTTTPGTSQIGLMLMTGDNVNFTGNNAFNLWWRSATTSATLEIIEYNLKSEGN